MSKKIACTVKFKIISHCQQRVVGYVEETYPLIFRVHNCF